MDKLKISISGVRGIVGETLTPEVVLDFARAFGTYIKSGRIVVARDTRPSGEEFKESIICGLLEAGCEIIDIGIAPTPTALLMVKELNAAGGIIITASHNPSRWNGLKFISSCGIFLKKAQVEEFLDIWRRKKFILITKDKKTDIERIDIQDVARRHIDKIISYVNPDIIRTKQFTVALDSCNGAGAIITPKLLEELGCKVIRINTESDGLFPHVPEPVPENLKQLCDVIRTKGADIGFAQDPDADRLAIVSEKGECIGEEYTLALACQFVLKKKRGVVVTNLSTTKAIDDIAMQFNSKVIRTKIGEINVVEKMKENNAVVGGEGNGGVIIPEVIYGRDSLCGIAVILEHLAESGLTISDLTATIPEYKMVKTKLEYPFDKVSELLEKIKDKYKGSPINSEDGVKINLGDSWVHIRPSNTEPVVRIIAEAKTRQEAEQLCESVKKLGTS